MRLSFLGAAKTVTGSKYLLQTEKRALLIDCGLFQGQKALRRRNWQPFILAPSKIDAIILTHAHIDHSGYIPLLVKNGFKGRIYCTQGTIDLCKILLPDSGYIQEEEAAHANKFGYSKHKPALPLYTREEAIASLELFTPLAFDVDYTLFQEFHCSFFHAGHIVGASSVRIRYHNKSILFSGDLGRPRHPLIKAPAMIKPIDYLVLESVYGDRLHAKINPLDQLSNIINQTIAKKGTLIIPAFAVGRSQDVLSYLYQLKQQNRLPDIPIYLDSPMAQQVNAVMIKYSEEHRLTRIQCEAISQIATYLKTADESKKIDLQRQSAIVIAASGMLEGGRVLHHLKAYLPDARHTVLLTGYQDAGTRGDLLLRGEKEIKIHGEMIAVRAEVKLLENMSAHADYEEILEWLSHLHEAPRKVFITHGDQLASSSLKEKIETRFGWHCVVPEYLQVETL